MSDTNTNTNTACEFCGSSEGPVLVGTAFVGPGEVLCASDEDCYARFKAKQRAGEARLWEQAGCKPGGLQRTY